MKPTIQHEYPDEFSYCYGCGRLNDHGLHVQSSWQEDQAVAVYLPQPHHIAVPGFVYGGLIASIMDCHAMATAAAATIQAEGEGLDRATLRFVTGSLHVDYLKPTPLGPPLIAKAIVKEQKGRKMVITLSLTVNEVETARGEIVAVRIPETMMRN
ncbi:MAG: PaaI family thioesterase [Anaerolineae bacterium]|nr:PaaI family thioesterase [Anaerolineae bacterium]